MTELPWDRFTPTDTPQPETPEPETPEPELPYVPPPYVPAPVPATPRPPAPAPPPDVNVQALAKDLLAEAMGYAKATIAATVRGQQVDHANPTITATTQQGRELVVADAKSRSIRTLIQGLLIDLTFALVAVLTTLTGADPFQRETWILFGSLLIKTAIQTVVSYIMRLKVTPTMKTEGTKLAIMPVPRPMMDEQEKQKWH